MERLVSPLHDSMFSDFQATAGPVYDLHVPWYASRRLWSLADMINFSLYELHVSLQSIRERRDGLHAWGLRDGANTQLNKSTCAWILTPLQLLQQTCDNIELTATSHRIREIQYRLEGVTAGCTFQIIEAELQGLETTLIADLKRHSFAYIPLDKVPFFEQDALFGEEVKSGFPSAAYDVKEAGNCLAAGTYTACVFHLMRVVEWGLRALAAERSVTFKVPIELQNWQPILDSIEANVKALTPTLSKKGRSDAQSFYNGILGEFHAFKDAWRNHVMHTRDNYDEHQALSAMNHVREFMQRLAERVSEGMTVPIAWA